MNIKRKEVFTLADNDMLTGFLAGQSDNSNNGGMFGNDSWVALILFALIFGWGRGGLGGFGGGTGTSACATQADLAAGFNNSTVLSSLDDIKLGQANAINYNNQGFSGLNTALMNGFHGVDNAVCNLGFQTQSGFNTLGAQLASCCCDIERGQDRIGNQITSCCCDVERQIERGFCETNANIAAQTRGIIDFLTNEKIDSLRAENQALRFSASQDRQNALLTTAMTQQTNALIDRIAPYPVPSFNVCAPYQFGGFGAYGGNWGNWNRGNDCGCGCGCG